MIRRGIEQAFFVFLQPNENAMWQRLLTHYFWTLQLFFLLTVGYLAARMTSLFVQGFWPRSTGYTLSVARHPEESLPRKQAATVLLAAQNIFDPKGGLVHFPSTTPQPMAPTASPSAEEGQPLRCDTLRDGRRVTEVTKLPLELKGTDVGEKPHQSLAAIVHTKEQRVAVYRTGELVEEQTKVCLIEHRLVILEHEGTLQALRLDAPAKKPPPRRLAPPPLQPTLPPPRRTIASVLNQPFPGIGVLQRDQLQEWLKIPLDRVGVRFAPNFRGGRPQGLRLTEIRDDSFYRQMGLKPGDVLMRVNGSDIYTPGHAHEMYQRFRFARNLSLEVIRNNRPQSLDFSIR